MLLLVLFFTFQVEAQEIKREKTFFGEIYSIGKEEEGIFGSQKEYRQVKNALESNGQSAQYLRKSQYFTYAGWIAMAAFLVAYDLDEDESFDEETFLVYFPVSLALGAGQSYYFKKAVNTYNVSLGINVSEKSGRTAFKFSYKF